MEAEIEQSRMVCKRLSLMAVSLGALVGLHSQIAEAKPDTYAGDAAAKAAIHVHDSCGQQNYPLALGESGVTDLACPYGDLRRYWTGHAQSDLQHALDSVAAMALTQGKEGGVVFLPVGEFEVTSPVYITGRHSGITLRGGGYGRV